MKVISKSKDESRAMIIVNNQTLHVVWNAALNAYTDRDGKTHKL